MKTYIISMCIATAMLLAACHSTQKNHNHSTEQHDHEHDHAGHNHDEHEGHDHSEHNHDDHAGHDHSDGEHDHGEEADNSEHSDEILFTTEQAKAVGLAVETVAPAMFQQVIKTSGQILAAQGDEAVIVATSNGVVSYANSSIVEGAAINAGQTIVRISAQKLLEGDPAVKAKNAYETAQKELQRAEALIADQIISAKEYEQIKLRYENAKNAYEAQASHITAGGVGVSSPISGYIKNRLVAQGEYVAVGQAIATVSQNKRLQLRAEVAENHYKSLRNIVGANFKTAYDEATHQLSDLNGKLLSFGKASGEASFFIPVTFEFDNVDDFIPGAFAEIFLLANPLENVISVPESSITEEQGLHFVYLQLDEEGYRKQEVALGQNNGERVQILKGLQAGERVVTQGVYQVKLAAIASVMPEGHSHSH